MNVFNEKNEWICLISVFNNKERVNRLVELLNNIKNEWLCLMNVFTDEEKKEWIGLMNVFNDRARIK